MSSRDVALPDQLLEGFRRFRTTRYRAERARYRQLEAEGQQPKAVVIACSDSRSAPETVFDAGPGELFVVRNVAALVPAYAPDGGRHAASAALEYAVRSLEVRSIVVMGHGRCGGIGAAIDATFGSATSDFVGAWVAGVGELASEIDPGRRLDPATFRQAVEHRSVVRSAENLVTFPWIADRVADGRLTIHGTWFDIGVGELHVATADGWTPIGDA